MFNVYTRIMWSDTAKQNMCMEATGSSLNTLDCVCVAHLWTILIEPKPMCACGLSVTNIQSTTILNNSNGIQYACINQTCIQF